ncbi:MAG: tRNA1(Val) (adenine(37)-N6)-methyltransferase [Ilumatobacteraceae bacterium]
MADADGRSGDHHDELLTDLTLDRLTTDVSVFQRRKGHRFSSDDVITAWAALEVCPAPERVLDLGCGLGSVLLHLAWSLPGAALDGIEVQDVSFELLRRNVAHNAAHARIGERVRIHHGDFREVATRASARPPYDLVTGTPPYFPPGTASHADDEQRTRARVETRGGIEAYVETGAPLLAGDGHLVVCGDADAAHRLHAAASSAGLHLTDEFVVIPRAGRPPLFSVWALHRDHTRPCSTRTLTLRDEHGERTADARMLRAFSGFPERQDPDEAVRPA